MLGILELHFWMPDPFRYDNVACVTGVPNRVIARAQSVSPSTSLFISPFCSRPNFLDKQTLATQAQAIHNGESCRVKHNHLLAAQHRAPWSRRVSEKQIKSPILDHLSRPLVRNNMRYIRR